MSDEKIVTQKDTEGKIRRYRVWVCVEEERVDEDTGKEEYEDIDLERGPVYFTEDMQDAIDFALGLHDSAM